MNKNLKISLIVVLAVFALGAGTCTATGFNPVTYFTCDLDTGVDC